MKMKETFKSTGLVYGSFWSGGEGAYPARKLEGNTKKEILEEANNGLNGNLDSGMGFENLIGALLIITKTTTIVIKGKTFTNDEIEDEFIGELTKEQQDFLFETNIYM